MAGIILVVLGAFALAYQGFTQVMEETGATAGPGGASVRATTMVAPTLAGGIALVTGLLMIAASGKRD